MLTLYYQLADFLRSTDAVPSKEELDKICNSEQLFRKTLLKLSCRATNALISNKSMFGEPRFTSWLETSCQPPPIHIETDPIFTAWLATYVPPGPETDPVFQDWAA